MSNGEQKIGNPLNRDERIYFLNQLKMARAIASNDAEAFAQLFFVFERLGSYVSSGKIRGNPGLGAYGEFIKDIADQSPLASIIPQEHSKWHSSFAELYQTAKNARNDALHQGAFARNITNYAIQLALILEDGLMSELKSASDFMSRDPMCAELWHPISFVRQRMLENAFSYLPIERDTKWYLIADYEIARYLREQSGDERRERLLAKKVEDAWDSLNLAEADWVEPESTIDVIITKLGGKPLLVFDSEKSSDSQKRLVGILTSFDLL